MESNDAETVATFTGTLLKRQRAEGKPFVQLIFREAGKDWLCLSTNIKHVASLQVGKTYRIEGLFKTLGDRQYIHEPDIMPIARQIAKRRVLISLGLGLGVVLFAGGIVLAATYNADSPKQHAVNTSNQTSVVQTSSTTSDTATKADTQPTDTTPTATTPTPTPTPKSKTTPKVTTPVVTPPANNNSVVNTPAPYCDDPVAIPFQSVEHSDPDQVIGYKHVTPGVEGQQQTCYPDGTPASATTTVSQQPVDEITDIGTATPPPDPIPGS